MCILCDGGSLDEALFSLHASVERYGWGIQGVERGPSTMGWVYSVGLAAGFDHPELVVVGGDLVAGAHLINAVGEQVRAGGRFEAGEEIGTPSGVVGVGLVHPAHIGRGLLAMWENYHDALDQPRPELVVLQLVLPQTDRCHEHQRSVPLLSDPEAQLSVPAPVVGNRAQRRQHQRSRPKPRPRRNHRAP